MESSSYVHYRYKQTIEKCQDSLSRWRCMVNLSIQTMFRSNKHLSMRKQMQPNFLERGSGIHFFGDIMRKRTKETARNKKRKKNSFCLLGIAIACIGFTVSRFLSLSNNIESNFLLFEGGRRRPAVQQPSNWSYYARPLPVGGKKEHSSNGNIIHAGLSERARFAADAAAAVAKEDAEATKRDSHSESSRFAHFCYSDVHGLVGTHILKAEMRYQAVDAVKNSNWTIMYGGYPHCAGGFDPDSWDWKMERGVNRLMNERGWNTLKPHQVYHPCMGCNKSYCQKRELCKILRDYVDPKLCYVLPEDMERLTLDMNTDEGQVPWVLKRDGSYVHIHAGHGVSYIQSPLDLPESETLTEGMHLVQRWNEPFLGEGPMRRISEVRIYLAVTSVYPLRAYAYNEMIVNVASTLYTNATDALHDTCMHDTHSHARDKCQNYPKELEDMFISPRQMKFHDYVDMVGMTRSQRELFINEAHELLAIVLNAGHDALDDHYGIRESGAMCFSHMRADMGITREGRPFLFEIAEFPGLYTFNEVYQGTTRDLFRMVGLDDFPVPPEEKESFEKAHLGGWRVLPIPKTTSIRRTKDIQIA